MATPVDPQSDRFHSPETVPAAGTAVRMRGRKPVRLAGAGVELSFGEADNPYFQRGHAESGSNPRRIKVARNSNESPLVRMVARGMLDARRARAGHIVRSLFERVTAGQRSSSFISERVDGGKISDGFTESRAQAALQLKRLGDEIGAAPYRLLVMVCGEGRSLADVIRSEKRRKASVREEFLAALDLAAEFLNLGRPSA